MSALQDDTSERESWAEFWAPNIAARMLNLPGYLYEATGENQPELVECCKAALRGDHLAAGQRLEQLLLGESCREATRIANTHANSIDWRNWHNEHAIKLNEKWASL